jgi:hypothetical protein
MFGTSFAFVGDTFDTLAVARQIAFFVPSKTLRMFAANSPTM